jgi:hypothetical protein
MKKIISHIFIVLSFVSFIAGCERDKLLSDESIALNAVKLQLNTTRTYDNPTLQEPNHRPNWVLEVQTEENALTNYIFSKLKLQWVPETTPIVFPNANSVYDIKFTLRAPTSMYNEGQNGTLNGLFEADTLEGILKNQSPRQITPYVSLSHLNSLVELVFDASVRDKITDITIEGSNVHLCYIDNGVYQFIACREKQQIILTIKYKGEDCQCILDFPSGTQANRWYEIPVSIVVPNTGIEKFVSGVPRVVRWSEELINGQYTIDNGNVSIVVEGYTKTIGVNFLGDGHQYQLEPYSIISGEKAVYHCPLPDDGQKQIIESIQLKALGTLPISIGRTIEETTNNISLKVGEAGNLLFRTDAEDFRLINTIAELQLISDNEDNLKVAYKQESDINFMSKPIAWTPIGRDESSPFSGFYVGNGYKISNMYVSKSLPLSDSEISQGLKEEEIIGFFGYNTGEIRNLHLASGGLKVNIISKNMGRKELYDYSIGTICGHNNGIIKLSYNSDYSLYLHIESSEKPASFYVGGISGKNEYEITSCLNNSKIEIIDNEGKGDLRVGGLIGLSFNKPGNRSSMPCACANHGELSVRTEKGIGRSTHGIGGLIGEMAVEVPEEGLHSTNFLNSYNSGTITYTIGSQVYIVGGVIGILEKLQNIRLESLYNVGEIYISSGMQTTSSNEGYLAWLLGKIEWDDEIQFSNNIQDLYYDYDATRMNKNEEEFIIVDKLIGNFTEENLSEAKLNDALKKFSGGNWPAWQSTDNHQHDTWVNLGDWNDGHPVYPKLMIDYYN